MLCGHLTQFQVEVNSSHTIHTFSEIYCVTRFFGTTMGHRTVHFVIFCYMLRQIETTKITIDKYVEFAIYNDYGLIKGYTERGVAR